MVAKDPKGLGSLAICKYLYPVSEDIETGAEDSNGFPIFKEVWKISMQDIGGMDADTKEAIRESWAYLMEVKDDGYYDKQDYMELGRDLFMYCFYQLGFDFSPLSFMHLAPTAVKDNIIVERDQSLPLKVSDGAKAGTDDVLVWSANTVGATENASDNFGARTSVVGELSGNAFQMPETLTVNDVRNLIHEAFSHPELKFKMDRDLTQEEFNLFTLNQCGLDVPSNVFFSQGTLSSVSLESKKAVSYGKKRTYRQLLNEILDGTEQGLNMDEFAQMFILNHPDNSRFILDVDRSSDRLKEIIKEQISKPGNTQWEGTDLRSSITIDVSGYQNEKDMRAIGDIVSMEEKDGRVVLAEWCPCIKINGTYYMAQSNTDLGFNINTSPKITYMKVEPWGTSKTIEYDRGRKLSPTLRYQTSMTAEVERNKDYQEPAKENNIPIATEESNSEAPIEQKKGTAPRLDTLRQVVEDYIFNEYIAALKAKNGFVPLEDEQGMREYLSKVEMEDLNNAVGVIRKACRENGVMMLNDEGEPQTGC